jgi:hypothetical protein
MNENGEENIVMSMRQRAGDEAAAGARALLKTAGRKKASPSSRLPKSGAATS